MFRIYDASRLSLILSRSAFASILIDIRGIFWGKKSECILPGAERAKRAHLSLE